MPSISARRPSVKPVSAIPSVITHRNMRPLLDALLREPYFQIGSAAPYDPSAWFWQVVRLEVPAGELARDGLITLALTGGGRPEFVGLTGEEGFAAQGLEGKAVIRTSLFGALMSLRDILSVHRGRIVTGGRRKG